jgi:anti-anti-sigma regulatory factor
VTLPEHIGASNAGQVRDALLSVINLGATTLIADMTATVSCDHAGADAVVRAWQRTVSSGTELRLVVTAGSVSRVLDLRGLDRQVSVYPSLEAAAGARLPVPAAVLAAVRSRRAGRLPDGNGAGPVPQGGLLDAVVTGLFHAGLGLQAAAGLPADAARQRTEAVISELDDLIRQIRDAAFADREQPGPPLPRAPGDAW